MYMCPENKESGIRLILLTTYYYYYFFYSFICYIILINSKSKDSRIKLIFQHIIC